MRNLTTCLLLACLAACATSTKAPETAPTAAPAAAPTAAPSSAPVAVPKLSPEEVRQTCLSRMHTARSRGSVHWQIYENCLKDHS